MNILNMIVIHDRNCQTEKKKKYTIKLYKCLGFLYDQVKVSLYTVVNDRERHSFQFMAVNGVLYNANLYIASVFVFSLKQLF